MFERVPAEPAAQLAMQVAAFRSQWDSLEKPQDVNALAALFPRVRVRQGYLLDYVQETSRDGVRLPIHPYARAEDDPTGAPLFEPGEVAHPDELAETLYPYLEYEKSGEGVFQYALFHLELFSFRASGHEVEWLSSTPLFTEGEFEGILTSATRPNEVVRPEYYGPLAHLGGPQSQVRFLVYTPMGWERIYYLESAVLPNGHVEHQAGDVLADMGLGHIF